MNDIKDIIEPMLMIEPEVLAMIVAGTILFTMAITGTLKIFGWYKLYITICVYATLLLMYIFRENEIVRWITTVFVGFGGATGLYQMRLPKNIQDKITGRQTPVVPEYQLDLHKYDFDKED